MTKRMRRLHPVCISLAAAAFVLAAPAAEARCVRTGQVYSCTSLSGDNFMLSCFGADTGVQTCIDSRGNSLLVGPRWHAPGGDTSSGQAPANSAQLAAEDAAFEAQLSSALAAKQAVVASTPPANGSTTKPPRAR